MLPYSKCLGFKPTKATHCLTVKSLGMVNSSPRSLSDRKISKRSIEKEFQLCQFETFSVHLNIKPYIC